MVRSAESGAVLTCQFVSRSIISIRRDSSDSYKFAEKNEWAKESDPWHKWPIEMAMKTAMHYAVSRGWCVIDDTLALRALEVDAESDLASAQPAVQSISASAALAKTLIEPEVEVETVPQSQVFDEQGMPK